LKIWLIGGTSESAHLAKLLVDKQVVTVVTVTTEAAKNLYLESEYLSVRVGKFDSDVRTQRFCTEEMIVGIIDASHPYAIAISQRAIAISQTLSLPYIRYERPNVEIISENVIIYDSFTSLLKSNCLEAKRVLLTVGCNNLHLFQNWHEQCALFTRVLPTPNSLKTALDSGFSPERIIAMRPPFSFDLEVALWRHWDISLVVSKANGIAGGEDIKQQVAKALHIPLILIARPQLDYPVISDQFNEIIKFLDELYAKKMD